MVFQEQVRLLFEGVNKSQNVMKKLSEDIAKVSSKLRILRDGNRAGKITTKRFNEQLFKLNGTLKSLQTSSVNQKKVFEDNNAQVKSMLQPYNSFAGAMSLNNQNFKTASLRGDIFTTKMAKLGERVRTVTAGFKGFKMALLGVLFFGLMIKGFFSSLLRPAADTVGIFELFSTTLELLFLPIILKLLPLFTSLLSFVAGLSDTTKLVIGAFALFGLALGTALFLIGGIGLGIGALSSGFTNWVGILGKTNKALKGLFFADVIKNLGTTKFRIAKTSDNLNVLNNKTKKFRWGSVAKVGFLFLGVVGLILLKKALDKFGKSSKKNADAVTALKDGFQLLISKSILEPLINSLSTMNIEIKDMTETQIIWGAIISSTLSSAVIGFGAFFTFIRSGFNVLQIAVQGFASGFLFVVRGIFAGLNLFGDFSTELKIVDTAITTLVGSMKSDVLDINDAWEKQIKLTKILEKGIISPSEAIENYRKELDKISEITAQKKLQESFRAADLRRIEVLNNPNGKDTAPVVNVNIGTVEISDTLSNGEKIATNMIKGISNEMQKNTIMSKLFQGINSTSKST